MLEKLAALAEKYDALTEDISNPEVIADQANWQKLMKAHADMEPIVLTYREYKQALDGIEDAKELLEIEKDAEMRELAQAELDELKETSAELEQQLKILLLPKDPNDEKNVILEIRAGTGGEEASLFAGDLQKMYSRYADRMGWRQEVLSSSYTDLGGIKEIVILVEGRGAYSKLKFESGVHRVQRVPETESGGRIHTSAATVAVLPEAEEVELEFAPGDIRVDLFCASGPGGQCVNTTQSAVRLTHIPTGIVVSCQDEKNQHKNREQAEKVLRARVLEKMMQEAHGSEAEQRKSMVGSGDRSERIRTYNFPQGRVTDHRIGLTLHKLDTILQGFIDELIEALITTD
ncbi:MAG: peptide chain release factor 1, partial [Firmicutes bacterium]|nr:peptide chain release factor 1 [Bacillota bacterium]